MRRNCNFRDYGQNSDTAVGLGDPDFLSGRAYRWYFGDRWTFVNQHFWSYWSCSCAEAAVSEVSVKILILPWQFAKESKKNLATRRSFQVLSSLHRSQICHVSVSNISDHMILNIDHMLRSALGQFWIFTNFELGQPIRCRLLQRFYCW